MNRYTDDLRCFPPWTVLSDPSPGSPLPELPYSFCQMELACVTVAILMCVFAEPGRVLPNLYAEHAIGPIVGLIFNALFAKRELIALDGVNTSDSTTTGSNCPLHVHLCDNGTCIRYDTYARESYGSDSITESSSDAEALGMDDAQIGEFLNDYIEVLPLHSAYWTPACNSGTGDSDLHAPYRWGPSWTPDTSMWGPQRRDHHVVNNHRERHLTPLSEKPQHEQQA
ncbi:hypothetical protein SCP_0113520 [Sparassis crispa]|uniref:Uncharacterized protein n=1 Tax=Sparassis crispa TaxID=139825 RepID=A0A401G8J9_9APHY|nr:hypothetical protein SCP_0113520 [Sparassis crispa]GBE78463.1 hypothetical protein SCP_0113520 [Sparassis crispa]